ncbi:hypothetical protein [Anabaena sp. 4-3]|uniref:hypothetical protein n=1 Tax=Anabaena sp. 4-3 TaxID=1811979 RepID=UPI000A7451C5|nr:hypothetical protein [Anabaena sp. 4-3]
MITLISVGWAIHQDKNQGLSVVLGVHRRTVMAIKPLVQDVSSQEFQYPTGRPAKTH